ncbi:MAG: acyl transferase [Flavobacteriales bacterium]|nr:acyl transferase [Flavobacteriales bacterium]
MSFAKQAQIFQINNDREFNEIALELFHYQAVNNPVYNKYIKLLGRDLSEIDTIEKIPFLPIELFKSHEVKTSSNRCEDVFTSSTTGGGEPSKHHVNSLEWYEEVYKKAFNHFYPDYDDAVFLCLLPAYLERKGSSLVLMSKGLIEQHNHPLSGFFLNNLEQLELHLHQAIEEKQKIVLLGVTFGLLDFAENRFVDCSLADLVIMETGGMKGRRKEMVREEVHKHLKGAFNLPNIHSEYGMTELLSQAYSKAGGVFHCPPWMKALVRATSDPFSYVGDGKTGGLNIIDLANTESCAFIETSDLGRMNPHGGFEVLGRFDHAEVRGCNLMVASE